MFLIPVVFFTWFSFTCVFMALLPTRCNLPNYIIACIIYNILLSTYI